MTAEPKDHVLRATLPWRPDEQLTECGRPADSFDPEHVFTRQQAQARYREWGQRRASLLFCMSCIDTAQRWPSWEQDPVGVISRAARGYSFGRSSPAESSRDQLAQELRALELLVAAHPDEFAEALAGLGETASLADARSARARRRHYGPR